MKSAARVRAPLAAALLMLGVPLEVSALEPSPPEPPPPELHLGSEPEQLGTLHVELRMDGVTAELAEQLLAELDNTLEQHATAVGLTAVSTLTADVYIEVELNAPKGAPVTTVSSAASIGAEVVARRELETCMRCEAPELTKMMLALVPQAADELRERVEAERAAAEATRDASLRATALAAPLAYERPQLGPAGYVGLGLTAVAVGVAVAGGGLLGRGEQIVGPPAGVNLTVTDYRPGGWALLGAALGGAVIGQALLGLDLGVLAPRRATRRAGERSRIGRLLGVGVAGKF